MPGYTPPPLLDTNLGLTLADTWQDRRMDPTGFYWIGARYYDPVAGRFLSPDPAGFEGSTWDLYSYCGNDPINKFDPTGRFGKSFGDGGTGLSSSLAQNDSDQDSLANFVKQMDDQMSYASSPAGQLMQGYQQTEADMSLTENAGYLDDSSSDAQALSSDLDMVPVVGGLKMMAEYGFTDRDLITGQRVGELGWGQTLGIAASMTPIALAYAPEETALSGELNLASREPLLGSSQATQLEFGFVNGDLSGRLASFGGTAAAQEPLLLGAPSMARLPQDLAVNPTAPQRLSLYRPIGETPAQQQALSSDIQYAQSMNALDIRVNQQQVNALGVRVGVNRPDLQYTRPDGTRVYIEYDNMTPATWPNTPRGPGHGIRILANDPNGVYIQRSF